MSDLCPLNRSHNGRTSPAARVHWGALYLQTIASTAAIQVCAIDWMRLFGCVWICVRTDVGFGMDVDVLGLIGVGTGWA